MTKQDSLMTTIYDVAREARVSTATVSRVLNGRVVRAELRARVMTAVEDLGYTPNGVARNLRRQTGSVWMLIISDVESTYFTSLVRGVESVASENGYSVVVCNSHDDPELEARHIEVALAEQMAGVILSPSRPDTDVSRLSGRRVPVVTIDRRLAAQATSTVLVDNHAAAEAATSHLLDGGYKRIGCITGPRQISTAVERLEGYRRALAARGLELDAALELMENYREDGGYRGINALLALPEPPDAVLACNGLLAVGALRALHDRGVAIPRDFGIVGFDDSPWSQVTNPPLTTVAQPTDALGRKAAELLLAPEKLVSTHMLSTELIVRGSSRR
ncbi:LacI family DNA-binding transcriptional regulator [Arthrobacter sp. 92]|uniref:LacI family DNA-binding transcriptional regulator n=1 Tax=Arthrobacter sp. 92 TaxID=3418175 RepID=UPI003D07A552